MPSSGIPSLSLAVTPLQAAGTNHFAIHVTQAPYPGGLVLRDCTWANELSQLWQDWQEMFSNRRMPPYPTEPTLAPEIISEPGQPGGVSSRLMQTLGVQLWQWLFEGSVVASLSHSQGIAAGQNKPLRLRLEIREPNLIALPWEIMQDAPGRQAISLSQQLLFSRTTSDVNALPTLRSDYALRILLVLGQATDPASGLGLANDTLQTLKLEQEAGILADVLKTSGNSGIGLGRGIACQVDTLVQPSPAELIQVLEKRIHNVLFYAGHGMPGPDGGLIFLRPDMALNGTELAQVLTRCQVKLTVFNACWGAQPDHYEDQNGLASAPGVKLAQPIPRSSLAEVLIHHGVPAVLAMRDPIADQEAISFIQVFAQALVQRMPIDQAVAVARQNLLTLYKFNYQTWTLPVLYMHPEFDGELLKPLETSETGFGSPELPTHVACLRSLTDGRVWQVRGGLMKIGRSPDNDLVLKEDEGGVSREHAMILCRDGQEGDEDICYFLEDFSRFGTWVRNPTGWQKVHHKEVELKPRTQIKFGSQQNEAMEFVILNPGESPTLG
ncbi:MAG: CHAT domain-containing protein [Leptolyngbyaceae cyanobacterium bins.302]|nr:CHAT domain-containing protein [Leptolyngbyaceae cyanobacterium bins.302]